MKVFLAGIERRSILTVIIVLAALVMGISLPGVVAAMTTPPGATVRALANVGGGGGAGQVAFFTSGTDIGSDPSLYWDNTNKRLGIGTETPSRVLHVKGNVSLFERSVNSAGFIIERNGADVSGYNRWVFGADEPTGFVIKTYPYDGATAVQQLVITKDNPSTPENESKVGVGTNRPMNGKLEVVGENDSGIFSTGNPAVLGQNTFNGNLGEVGSNGAGVLGSSINGLGVNGFSYSGTGVKGESTGSTSYGVYGENFSSSGVTYGVYGKSNSSDGTGVYGTGSTGVSGSSANGYGVIGQSSGSLGTGVYGYDGAGGNGVYGASSSGLGVYGTSSSSFGVYGQSADSTGVYGSSSSGYGVRGWSNSGVGVAGEGATYDFYANGPGVNYGAFTGAHEVKLAADFAKNIKPGLIVSVTGETQLRNENGQLTYSSTLPTVQLAATPNDKKVFGVLIAESPLPEDHWYQAKEGERFGIVNALGEGRVWVTNLNGDIEAGDYITTSVMAGYGQKQADDILHSYTQGKAIENVDWSKVAETIELDGKVFKAYPIAVVYTSG